MLSIQYIGRVIACGKQTAKVNVTNMKMDPEVNMLYKWRRKYFTADPDNQCKPGDLVVIRNLFRKADKCNFELVKVVERAQSYVHPETGKVTFQDNFKD